ncbi:MAG: hypothetical protein ACFB13_20945 [Kiloniellaceae bacterium]
MRFKISMPRALRAAAVAGTLLLTAAPAGAAVQGVSLHLTNGGDRPLRCVMVIAHFMSHELGAVAPGDTLGVALERDDADGSLFVRSADGRAKMIENILCGASDDWSRTRGEVPLLPLRSMTSVGVAMTCRLEGRLHCVSEN